ncbi:MAG TPA: TetR/AcrR family transcriptional regulator [Polyangiaceae bacterium]|nr:TetR/AcrR family transcriptional regulator [Polyangiaceae bacterium]
MGTERTPRKRRSKAPAKARVGRLKKGSRVERGRPRDEAATEAILQQTILLLAKKGYRGFRLEDVAAEAAVSKSTVYRRWASKQRLVCDAVRAALSRANPLSPDTGDVRRDVVTVLQGTTTVLNGPLGSAVRALVSEVMFDRELSTVLKQLEMERRGILRGTIERALAAGALVGETELLIDVLAGAAWYQLLVRQGKPALTLGNDVTGLLWRSA